MVLTGSSAVALFLRYVVIASLETRTLVIRETIYSSTKLVLAIILVTIGWDSVGLTIGYTIGQILAAILLASAIIHIYRIPKEDKSHEGYLTASIAVVKAGFPSWIPALIASIGSQLGTIVVYGVQGAGFAGAYFIAFSIASGITSFTYSLLSSTFPALSAMTDGRKRFAWELTKISLVLAAPIVIVANFFPHPDYVAFW